MSFYERLKNACRGLRLVDLAQKLRQTLGNKCWQDNLDIVVVVVVQWSTYLPSIPMIWIRILLWSTVFLRKLFFEKQENKQKEASISQFLGWFRLCSYCGFLSLYLNPTPVALTEQQVNALRPSLRPLWPRWPLWGFLSSVWGRSCSGSSPAKFRWKTKNHKNDFFLSHKR